jgi:hypothetical protein
MPQWSTEDAAEALAARLLAKALRVPVIWSTTSGVGVWTGEAAAAPGRATGHQIGTETS